MKEAHIKAAILEYLQSLPAFYCYPRTLQIAGIGGRRNLSVGMSDLLVCFRGKYLAIEVKTDTGQPSEKQCEYMAGVKRAGGHAIVARSVFDVIEYIDYLNETIDEKNKNTM